MFTATCYPLCHTLFSTVSISLFYMIFFMNISDISVIFLCSCQCVYPLAARVVKYIFPVSTTSVIALRSRVLVIEIFWHLDSFLSFVNCIFIHSAIIFHFLELYFTHWIGYLATLRYEVCNYLFVSWTKVHDAFYIFPECLVGTCTVNGSYWG